MENIKLLYIDLFCGAGGTSTGVEHATVDGERSKGDGENERKNQEEIKK